MPYFLAGLLALFGFLYFASKFVRANPAQMAQRIRIAAGWGLVIVAALLAITGRWAAAAPIAAIGLGMLGKQLPFGPPFGPAGSRTRRSSGARSQVRSAWFEMELDHDSGRLTGRVVKGPRAGAALDDLAVADLAAMLSGLDGESRSLLEAYLDRRQPGWREDVEGDGAAGRGERDAGTGPMSQNEAYEILGLEPGADAQAIRKAHRALMAKFHPDRGGSTYLAAKINAAKDLLLSRHRARS